MLILPKFELLTFKKSKKCQDCMELIKWVYDEHGPVRGDRVTEPASQLNSLNQIIMIKGKLSPRNAYTPTEPVALIKLICIQFNINHEPKICSLFYASRWRIIALTSTSTILQQTKIYDSWPRHNLTTCCGADG